MQPIDLTWMGGEHPFILKLSNLRHLQSVCDAGPEEILTRVSGSDWRVDDLFETIRQGLIGGGMKSKDASEITTRVFHQHPMHSFKQVALLILIHSLTGDDEEDDEGKPEGAETEPPANGLSPASTETAQ